MNYLCLLHKELTFPVCIYYICYLCATYYTWYSVSDPLRGAAFLIEQRQGSCSHTQVSAHWPLVDNVWSATKLITFCLGPQSVPVIFEEAGLIAEPAASICIISLIVHNNVNQDKECRLDPLFHCVHRSNCVYMCVFKRAECARKCLCTRKLALKWLIVEKMEKKRWNAVFVFKGLHLAPSCPIVVTSLSWNNKRKMSVGSQKMWSKLKWTHTYITLGRKTIN